MNCSIAATFNENIMEFRLYRIAQRQPAPIENHGAAPRNLKRLAPLVGRSHVYAYVPRRLLILCCNRQAIKTAVRVPPLPTEGVLYSMRNDSAPDSDSPDPTCGPAAVTYFLCSSTNFSSRGDLYPRPRGDEKADNPAVMLL